MAALPRRELPSSWTLSDKAVKAEGLRYFVEVALAKDAVVVWSEWRGSVQPTLDDKLMAVSYYATHDAYLPLD